MNTLNQEVPALCAKQCVKEATVEQIATEKQEMLFMVYENLLESLKEKRTDSIMARFFIPIEKQLEDFEEQYPEVVTEYYLKHRP